MHACTKTHKHTEVVYTKTHNSHTYPSTCRHTQYDTQTLASSLCVTNLPKARRRGHMSLRSCGDNELGLKCITLRLARRMGSTIRMSLPLVPHTSPGPCPPSQQQSLLPRLPGLLGGGAGVLCFLPSLQSWPDGQIHHSESLQNEYCFLFA